MDLQGWNQLMNLIQGSGRDVNRYMEAALWEEANEAFLVSQELTPVRDGYLKGSGSVKAPRRTGSGIMVEIYYGGSAAPYAQYVHDIPMRHAPPTTSGYLKKPVDRQAQGMGDRLAARVEHMFRSELGGM